MTSTPIPQDPDDTRGPRVSTVVWGLVVTALGVGVIALATGSTIDVGLAAIVLLAGAGVALLIGSLTAGMRRNRPPSSQD
ncbi:MAG: hypothetical protein KJ548_07225 [Actinobacteria bacterium]|nr:hypothetical protein [Actinomycetota bacterium]MCG2798486.1 hypothetical protein [Cellulomonas sp.]